MDPTVVKSVAAGLAVLAAVALALTGKVDGASALEFVKSVTGVFIGSVAFFGGTKVIAGALSRPALPLPPPVPPAERVVKQ